MEIPLSLGPRKESQDKEGGVCLVFDFVVAPATLDVAQANPGMLQTVVETVSSRGCEEQRSQGWFKTDIGPLGL